jgi:hypothetical protein
MKVPLKFNTDNLYRSQVCVLIQISEYMSDNCRAKMMKCFNADWPDVYGHYREAKFTQIKHHWWWKANRVFDQLKVTRNFNGEFQFANKFFSKIFN